eukprot:m.155713 g.155713  ORF g.155713 m.155713 type:complete len:120 (+) comp14311_c0_seq18:1836-2195(+)
MPAHLVIIKGTTQYTPSGNEELNVAKVLQMIGRAGRPQFDTHGVALILTRQSSKAKYESLLNGMQPIESSLHLQLVEHLNAEIALGTIQDGTCLVIRYQVGLGFPYDNTLNMSVDAMSS